MHWLLANASLFSRSPVDPEGVSAPGRCYDPGMMRAGDIEERGRRLGGRIALVTGAGRGIGRAIATRFLEEGAAVCLADRDAAALADAADELGGLGRIASAVVDVSREESVAAGVARAADALGGLHLVVNNAGVSAPRNAPVDQLAEADWRRVLDTNLTGPFLVAKHAAPHLRRAPGGGAIINIASTRALQSEPNTEAYAASKGGLVALTHALALSLGPMIRVHCISPGWIDTSGFAPRGERAPAEPRREDHAQHPAGRVGRPEDVASLCAWLGSADAGFVTGQNFIVDGGMTRKMIYAD
jgi:NAD(P)-dependent dehydrogenase (short-subunit alcohol dehydrogenase family)